MKTIEIQNCTDLKDKFFKVFINGEKHAMRFSLRTQVADEKPFQIKVKYFWNTSPVYMFEPKDNLKLQIFVNRRLLNWNWLGAFLGATSGVMITRFNYSPYVIGIVLLLGVIYSNFLRKRHFVIREFSETEKVA